MTFLEGGMFWMIAGILFAIVMSLVIFGVVAWMTNRRHRDD